LEERVLYKPTAPYIAFTDVFVYDYTNVDERILDDDSLSVWNLIKEQNLSGSSPLYYIQLSGYCPFYSNDIILPLSDVVAIG
jgi:hypothetical protein